MIKKISILTAMALLVTSAAYASGTLDCTLTTAATGKSVYGAKTGTATATSPLIGKSSTGVCVGMATASSGYAFLTQHINGTKAFGTTFDSTAIMSADATKGTAFLVKPTASTVAGFTGTWTSM